MSEEFTTLAEALTRIRALEREVADVRRALSTVRSASVTLIGSMQARTLEEERVLRSLAAKDRREVLVDLDAAREEARRWNEAATEATERAEEFEAMFRALLLALRDALSCSNDCDNIATFVDAHDNRRCRVCVRGDGWRELPIAPFVRAADNIGER